MPFFPNLAKSYLLLLLLSGLGFKGSFTHIHSVLFLLLPCSLSLFLMPIFSQSGMWLGFREEINTGSLQFCACGKRSGGTGLAAGGDLNLRAESVPT